MPKKVPTKCESCLMPFSQDPGPRESDRYCSYCFKNGALFAWMIKFAPRWKK